MAHATHFLSRLSRATPRQVEFALTLYRDAPLVKDLVSSARVPEGAARVAIALDSGPSSPHVLVTRDGAFVTCLGAEMGFGELPVISRAAVDSALARQQDLRDRFAAAELLSRDRDTRLLDRLLDAGDRLTREEMYALGAVRELVLQRLVEAFAKCEKQLDLDAQRLRTREGSREHAIDETWRRGFAAGHLRVLLAPRLRDFLVEDPAPGLEQDAWRLVCGGLKLGVSSLLLRGVWAAARIGKPLLPIAKRHVASPSVLDYSCAVLSLGAIALRHQKLEAEVRKALSREIDESLEGARHRRIVRDDVLAMLDDPDKDRAIVLRTGRMLITHAPGGMEIPDDIAVAAFATGGFSIGESGFPMVLAGVPAIVRLEAEDLYLPREWVERAPIFGGHLGRRALGIVRERVGLEPVTVEATPGRNDPCSCGSGRKFKKCCGG